MSLLDTGFGEADAIVAAFECEVLDQLFLTEVVGDVAADGDGEADALTKRVQHRLALGQQSTHENVLDERARNPELVDRGWGA